MSLTNGIEVKTFLNNTKVLIKLYEFTNLLFNIKYYLIKYLLKTNKIIDYNT